MKATRKTIPTLIENRETFRNGSGTLRAIVPEAIDIREALTYGGLNDAEKSRLRIDSEQNRITYMIVSFKTPIAWETADGHVYKVEQTLTQTSEQHKGLLYLFFRR